MPVATVQVERLLTCIKKILGDWHLSLNLELVDALLRIAVDGPDTDSFKPSRAVHHCYSTAHRNSDNSFIQESFNVLSWLYLEATSLYRLHCESVSVFACLADVFRCPNSVYIDFETVLSDFSLTMLFFYLIDTMVNVVYFDTQNKQKLYSSST